MKILKPISKRTLMIWRRDALKRLAEIERNVDKYHSVNTSQIRQEYLSNERILMLTQTLIDGLLINEVTVEEKEN